MGVCFQLILWLVGVLKFVGLKECGCLEWVCIGMNFVLVIWVVGLMCVFVCCVLLGVVVEVVIQLIDFFMFILMSLFSFIVYFIGSLCVIGLMKLCMIIVIVLFLGMLWDCRQKSCFLLILEIVVLWLSCMLLMWMLIVGQVLEWDFVFISSVLYWMVFVEWCVLVFMWILLWQLVWLLFCVIDFEMIDDCVYGVMWIIFVLVFWC